MTRAEPAPGQPAGTRCRCAAGSRWQEAVTGGVTRALSGPDAAAWRQEADLSDPGTPSRLVEPAAAISRFLDILGGHHAGLPDPPHQADPPTWPPVTRAERARWRLILSG